MSQDSSVIFHIFLGIGLILLVISAIVFYYHFTFYQKDAVHTEGVIVDTVWHSVILNDVDDNGSWYPVVAFRPARLHANFQFECQR